jgi:hypothetical protein
MALTVPRAGSTTIKGKCGKVVILEDRDDNDNWETLLGNAPMPSDMCGHKPIKCVIPLHTHGPQTWPQMCLPSSKNI